MLSKILLTLFVIIVAALVIGNRRRRGASIATQRPHPPLVVSPPSRVWRWTAYGLAIVMILGSGLYLYREWREYDRVVTVRVIDTLSGDVVRYRARRKEVQERRFTTLDGREVSVANNERIELQTAAASRPDSSSPGGGR